jgi:hypothetical protein
LATAQEFEVNRSYFATAPFYAGLNTYLYFRLFNPDFKASPALDRVLFGVSYYKEHGLVGIRRLQLFYTERF